MVERPALILLSGLLCDRATWAHQEAALADRATITIPDLHGFDSLVAMAESVLAAAPRRFAVCGHSMGARVALEIVRMAPERVERLALLDTGVHPPRPNEPEARHKLVALAREHGMPALAAAWIPPMLFDHALLDAMTAMVCRATPDIFAGQVKALLGRPDAAPLLGTITCPTLVGVGREDAWSPVAQHEPIAAAIRGARLVVFEGAGHMAPMEAPAAVTAALRDWLG